MTAPPEYCLRPAEAADSEVLFAIYASSRADELAPLPWDATQKYGFLRLQFEAQRRFYLAEYPGADFQLIIVGAEPVGRLYIHRRPGEIRVMDLTLLPHWQRRGLGTSVLSNLLTEGERTLNSVTLHVEAHNPARQLYDRLGFHQAGSHGIYDYLEWKPPACRWAARAAVAEVR